MSALRFALVSVVPRITLAFLDRIARAYRVRGARTAATWARVFPDVTAPEVVVRAAADLQDGDSPIVLGPTIDLPGADAYHYLRQTSAGATVYYGLVLVDDDHSDEDVEEATGHELNEALVDPPCSRYLARRAVEVGDPTQGVPDPVELPGETRAVAFAATVEPPWFGVGTGATTSTGLVLTPGAAAPRGYVMLEDGTEVHGHRHLHGPKASHLLGRRMRRLELRSPSSAPVTLRTVKLK